MVTENWTEIGNLKLPRHDHMVDIFNDKLYVIRGSEFLEYCDFFNDFGCTVLTNARFEQKDFPILYGFYPSKCELGIFYRSCKTNLTDA